jgi:hypothetical protein
MSSYTYTTMRGINSDRLKADIIAAGFGPSLKGIDTALGNCTSVFSTDLNKTEEATLGAMVTTHDPLVGPLNWRPVGGVIGDLYWVTDTLAERVDRWNGSAWVTFGEVGPPNTSGLGVTWATTTTVQIQPGRCRDSGDTKYVRAAAALTIDTGVVGAGGIDASDLDPPASSDTTYYTWLVAESNGSSPVGIASLSATAPTMPGTTTLKKLLGWFRTDKDLLIHQFTDNGDGARRLKTWQNLVTDRRVLAAGTAAAMTDVDCSAWAATGFLPARAWATVNVNTSSAQVHLRPNGSSVASTARVHLAGATNQTIPFLLDAAGIVEYQRVAGTGTIDIDVDSVEFYV